MIKESHPAFSDTKEKARADFMRTHRSQDHGTRGSSHLPTHDQDWLTYAPRRVKAAEASTVDIDSLTDYSEATHDGLKKMRLHTPKWLIADPLDDFETDSSEEEFDTAAPLDPDSAEYEAAFDELESFLNRNGITGEDRVRAAEEFKNDPYVQHALLELVAGLAEDSYPTSYDQVDSSNRRSARSMADYQVEGTFDDDDGDYHVPHMSVRS